MQDTCKELDDNGELCGRVLFTVKSGLCARHYDRARTARLAQTRPKPVMVRDQKCFVCTNAGIETLGYRKWDGDPPDSVVCKRHWDMWRRRGTFEEAQAGDPAQCSVGECTKRVHARGMCQWHDRNNQRTGDPLQHPARTRWGSTDHRKKDPEQLAADLQVRRDERIGKDCGNGHILAGENLKIEWDGALTCRACNADAQRRYLESEKGKASKEARKEQDARSKQAREFYHLHGMTRAQYDARLLAQNYRCASCGDALNLTFGSKGVCTDHDHRCCPGPQSCGACIRGLLCPSCNVGNGFFKDDPVRMVKNAIYVLNHRGATDAEYEALAEMLLYES